MQKGQREVDADQSIEKSPRHAMKAPNQSRADAINEMRKFFCDGIEKFGKTNNFEALGRAIHPIQDAYSPAHEFNSWTGSNILPHLFESLMMYPDKVAAAVRAVEWIYKEIESSSELDQGRIGAIFDAWLWRYENNVL